MSTATDPRYPIGLFEPDVFTESRLEAWLADIRFLPHAIENAVLNLDEPQLMTPYREGGWTVHQVVHHVADSHMNAYTRFKLGYTEDNVTVKPYDENLWSLTSDVQTVPVNVSITLLYALHRRWYEFLISFTATDWEKTIYHPGLQKQLTLWHLLGMYSWHGRHHTAHITELRRKMGW